MSDLHRDLTLQGVEALADAQDITAERRPDGLYEIRVVSSSEAVAMLMQCLRLLMAVSGRIHGQVRREQVHAKADETVQKLRDQERAVARLYWEFRDKGYRHRIAVACTLETSRVCQQLGWTKTDVGYCMKVYSKEQCYLSVPGPNHNLEVTICD